MVQLTLIFIEPSQLKIELSFFVLLLITPMLRPITIFNLLSWNLFRLELKLSRAFNFASTVKASTLLTSFTIF